MGVIQRMISGLAVALALGLGAGCLFAAVMAQGGRFSPRLDLLTHFAPFWLLGALVALACGLAVTSAALRPLILIVAGLGIVASAALILPEVLRPIRPAVGAGVGRQVKLIQLNAWNENVDVEGTADWVARQNPDLVLVEEVEEPIRLALIKRGFHYSRGMVRTAIFSRIAPSAPPFFIAEPDWHVLPPFARATFDGPDGSFSVISTHFTWPTKGFQKGQARALDVLVHRYDTRRLILAGDFNLTPWSFALRRIDRDYGLERRDRAIFSWPARPFLGHLRSPLAFLPIDHVYAGSAWRTVRIERGPRLGSDHYPVMITLALTD